MLAAIRRPKNRIVVLGALVAFLLLFFLSRHSLSKAYTRLGVPGWEYGTDELDEEVKVSGIDDYKETEEETPKTPSKPQVSEDATSEDNESIPDECKEPLHFLDEDKQRKNPVALASFPGSGNTWLRFLIEQGTRVYTGSAYQDSALNETYKGEGIMTPKTIAVKTHYPCPNCWTYQKCGWCAGTLPVKADMTGIVKGADAAVFMLRSPFDALLAEFNRLRTGEHAGRLKPEAFSKVPAKKSYETEYDKPTWSQFVNQRLVAYSLAARTYLDRVTDAKSPKQIPKQNLLDASELSKSEFIAADRFVSRGGKLTKLVFYERLKADPERELVKVFQFFQDIYEAENKPDSILSPPTLAAKCAVAHNDRAKRTHFKWLRNNTDVFNPWKKGQVQQVCDVLGKWWFKEVWGECMDGLLQIQRNKPQ